MERTPQLQVVEKMQDTEQFMLPFILKKRKKRRGEENKNIFCFCPQNPTSSYLPQVRNNEYMLFNMTLFCNSKMLEAT